jgi:predicted permease
VRAHHKIRLRLRSLFRRRSMDRELDDELCFHLDQLVEENAAAGMTPEEARRSAVSTMGGISQFQEECRDMRRINFIDGLLRDLQYAGRMMQRNPVFTGIAILTLALGIGPTSIIFSVVDTALLKPLPFHDPDRLLSVWGRLTGIGLLRDQNGVSPPEYTDLCVRNRVLEGAAAHDTGSLTLTGDGEPERIEAAFVTASFFPLLGVQPAMGRAFTADEDRPDRSDVVVISHDIWQSRFGADLHIIGRRLRLDGVTRTVIGVMPAGFELFGHADLWAPLAFTADQLSENQRGSHYLNVIARLKKGVSFSEMQSNLDQIADQLLREHPAHYHVESGWGIRAASLAGELTYDTRPVMLMLAGAVSLLLWIACANVANLLLARGSARQREMTVRSALGAGRARLLRQLFTENTLIAIAAGILGVAIAWWSGTALPRYLPTLPKVQLDGRVAAFAFLISLLTSLLFGILPAFEASRPSEATFRVAGSRRSRRMHSVVVVSEIALSLVLLTGAGLLIKSFVRLLSVDPGFNPQGVLTVNVTLPETRYSKDQEAAMFYRRAIDNVKAVPGVDAAGFVSHLPLGGRGSSGCIDVQDHPSDPSKKCPEADRRPVTADYFRAMGIPLIKGRYFDSRDDAEETPRVAIVDETLAAQFWPGEDPIGKRIKTGHSSSKRPWLEVVGVVRHVRSRDLAAASRIQVYWPYSQGPWPFGALVVRTRLGNPKALTRAVEAGIHAADAEMAVYGVRTMDEVIARSVAQRKIAMTLLFAFSTVAVLLAAIGVYGVLAYSVSQRSREIGIRMAVGARAVDVAGMIAGDVARLALAGIAAGALTALGLARLTSSLLYGVSYSDAAVYAAAALTVAGMVLLAAVAPVRRAASMAPIVALRLE